MKYTKKLLSLVLVLVLALALAVPGFAATITIEKGVKGETYTAYKIFDVTSSGNNYAYTIANSSAWKSVVENYVVDGQKVFTLTPSVSDATKLVVTVNKDAEENSLFASDEDAAAFATYLSTNIPTVGLTKNMDYFQGIADEDGAVNIGEDVNMPAGYYFVDTSLGSLCSLYTNSSTQEIEEKNQVPGVDKEADKTSASVGDTINYTVTVTNGIGTDSDITVYDYMTSLDFNNDIVVYLNNKTAENVVSTSNYEVGAAGQNPKNGKDYTFKITIDADYVKTLDQSDMLIITYSADVTADAIVTDPTNTYYMEYSEQTIDPNTPVVVHVYSFDLVKTDGDNNVITGAKFKLYDAQNGGNEIPVVYDDKRQVYRPALEGETGVVIEAGKATVDGLASGIYWLQETEAPAGYNLLTERKSVTISNADNTATVTDNVYASGGLQVINETGLVLPSTGGMGTTIFYTLGGVLVVGAAILLVTKKRVHDVEG